MDMNMNMGEPQPVNMGGMYMGMSTLNHTDMFCFGGGQVMLNGFQNARDGNYCFLFLFPNAVVNTPVRYGFAILGGFLLAFLSELMVIFRNRVTKWTSAPDAASLRVTALSATYGVQMVVAYFCMLLAMTYEGTLFAFIILGFFAGHFVYLYDRHRQRQRGSITKAADAAASLPPANPSTQHFSPRTVWLLQSMAWALPRMSWFTLMVIIIYWDVKVEGNFGQESLNLFTWHALCMTLAGPILMSEAILLFSAPAIPTSVLMKAGCVNRLTAVRCTHVILHICTLLLAIMGMVSIAYYKTESGMSNMFPFFTLYSPHSWLGMAVMVLWVLQFFVKAASTLLPTSETTRLVGKRIHVFFGHAIYIVTLVVCALGLQDMQSSDLAGQGYVQDGLFAYLACAGVVLLIFLGISVYLAPEIKAIVKLA